MTAIKNRKIVQWTLGYLAAAWIILQVTQLFSSTYDWSPTIMRAMPVALAAGLLIVLVIAWFHGEKGTQRATALEGILILAILVAGGIAVTLTVRSDTPAADVATAKDSTVIRLAVLPFEGTGTDDAALIADGISDEIRGKLASIAGLEVIARQSSNAYRKTTKSSNDVARELRVQYLLTGTVRSQSAGNGRPARIRVSPELVQVANARSAPVTRWQEPYDAELTDIFDVQTTIARRVAQGMDVALGRTDQVRIAEKPTSNLEAYQEYLATTTQGLVMTAPPTGVAADAPWWDQMAARLERAVQLDPNFSRAWSSLASVYGLGQFYVDRGNKNGDYAKRSRHAAEQAMRLSPAVDGHLARAGYLQWAAADYQGAAAEYEAAFRAAPRDPKVLFGLCVTEQFLTQYAIAFEHCSAAAAINPLDMDALNRAAVSAVIIGRPQRGIELARRAQEVARGSQLRSMRTGSINAEFRVHAYSGDIPAAQAALDRAMSDTAIAADVITSSFQNLYWVMKPTHIQLALAQKKFGNDHPDRALAYYALRDSVAMKREAAAAEKTIRKRLREVVGREGEALLRRDLAFALALQGKHKESVEVVERSASLMPIDADGISGARLHRDIAWIYLMAGDKERSLRELAEITALPRNVTKAAIRMDPRFNPLRGDVRFQRIVR